MITDTKIRIISYIKTNGQAKVKDLVDHLGLGNVAIHRQLKNLVKAGQLAKVGTPPKVFYILAAPTPASPSLPADALIELTKAYRGEIRVAQKTLGRLEERIQNARETIFVSNTKTRYQRVLLIDDAVGSAATLNETAKKLKNMGIAKEVYGFALVGSLKGFEVIREV